MRRSLYKHQERALEELPVGGGYLAFEQGLGKSLTAIQYAKDHDYEVVLIVCPAIAIGVWEEELALEGRHAFAPEGTRSQKAEQIWGDAWIILNYEALLDRKVEDAIKDWDPDLIIIDEAQKIKNPTAKRSKVLHRLTKNTPVLCLSGTPVTKNLLDLYSQYKAIHPAIWDYMSWTKFKATYGIWGGYGGYELIGYQNTDDLKARIKPITVVGRKESTLDLPPKTHVRVPVRLSGDDWSDYRQMAKEGVLGDWITSNPLEKALRLRQISGQAKLAATSQLVHDLIDQEEQVVVYCNFKAEGRALSDILGVPYLSGDTSKAEREHMVAEFKAGTNAVLLAQITAGSTALTLTNASYMVYHSLSYAYEDWAQSQDRIHRIGQYDPCTYYYMTSTGPEGGRTIDGLMLESLNRKEDTASVITRDPSLLLPEDT